MKRLIVGSLQALSTVMIFLILAAGLLSGAAAGREQGNMLIGAFFGLFVAFVIAMLTFGVIFIMLEMDDNLRAIRAALDRQTQQPRA